MGNELLEALQALVKVSKTRPLAELVDQLSRGEYARLVRERSCLSQLLDKGTWKSSCAKGRKREEYVEFVRFLRQERNFDGMLAAVPPNPHSAEPARHKPAKMPKRKTESSVDEAPFDTSLQTSELEAVRVGLGSSPSKRLRPAEAAESPKFKIKLRLPVPSAVAPVVQQIPGTRHVPSMQGITDGSLSAKEDLDLFDLDVGTDSLDELDGEYLREQLDTVVFDSVEWSRNLPQLPNEFGGNYTFWESEQGNSAAGKLERPASLGKGVMSRSDGAAVIPLVAVAALVLFVLAVVFRLRVRGLSGRPF